MAQLCAFITERKVVDGTRELVDFWGIIRMGVRPGVAGEMIWTDDSGGDGLRRWGLSTMDSTRHSRGLQSKVVV